MKSFQKDKEVLPQHEVMAPVLSGTSGTEEQAEVRHEIEITFPPEFKIPEMWPPTTAVVSDTVDSSILSENLLFPTKSEQAVPTSQIETVFDLDSDDHKFDREESPEVEFPHKIDDYEKLEDLEPDEFFEVQDSGDLTNIDKAISLMKIKNNHLLLLRENLIKAIQVEHKEIESLKGQLKNKIIISPVVQHSENLDKVMDLLHKENQILQIKKINLVRQIIEQQEICIDYRAKIELYNSLQK